MAWYIVWRNQKGKLAGFIVDDDEMPMEYKTEGEALEAMRDHILRDYSEIIEI